MKSYTFACDSTAETKREEQNRVTAYRAAAEGIVLLKNDGLLPLSPCKIAVFGAGASHTVKGGWGAGTTVERHSTSLLEGLFNAGFQIVGSRWLSDYEREYDKAYTEWHEARLHTFLSYSGTSAFCLPCGRAVTEEDIASSYADVALYAVVRQPAEDKDGKAAFRDFQLTDAEVLSVTRLCQSYKNTVLVINAGTQMDLSPIENLPVSAIFYIGCPGMEGGTALASLITGKITPSGKLSDTWVKRYEDIPFSDSYRDFAKNQKTISYDAGLFVGYRYFDTFDVKPRFPFGFGLSYTTFGIRATKVTLSAQTVSLSIGVVNTGARPGKETVQIYVSAPKGKLIKERMRLVAFGKTKTLTPTEPQILDLSFNLYDCASYSEESAAYLLEAGQYVVRLGNASTSATPIAVLTVDAPITLTKLKNIYSMSNRAESLIPPHKKSRELLTKAVSLSVCSADFQTEAVSYDSPIEAEAETAISKLSVWDMARLCVGENTRTAFSAKKIFVPGAAVRTTDKLYRKGLINISMANGYAGLHLLRESTLTSRRKIKVASDSPSFDFTEGRKLRAVARLKKQSGTGKALYQYATAFPAADVLAQTWNPALCTEVGRAVSVEMSEYGVTCWLTSFADIPATPLCPNRFMSFSEDPVLSGTLTAALAQGVQSVPGNYMALKAFAAPNLPDNQTAVNHRIEERALREIYWKGVEVCIRKNSPYAIVTDGKTINSVQALYADELCTAVLRNEWHYKGMVMAEQPHAVAESGKAALAIRAGNDFIMTGGFFARLSLLFALLFRALSVRDLRRAALRVANAVTESNVAAKFSPKQTK